jgi:hypothetical protein
VEGSIVNYIKSYRYYIAILVFYYFCFLLITPLGSFNPGVPASHSYSLTTIDPMDDTLFYMKAKSLIVDGDLDYNNEHLGVETLSDLNRMANPRMGAATQIGPSILFAPFVLLAHLLVKAANGLLGLHLVESGYSSPYLMITCMGSSMYAFLSLLIGFTILKKYFPPNVALLSVLTVFIGNSVFYYAYVRMMMSHSAEVFTVALFVFFYIKILERGELNDYLLFGLAYGLMGIVRYENAIIYILLPLFDLAVVLWDAFRSRGKKAVIVKVKYYGMAAIVASAVFSMQITHFYIQSGHFLPGSLEKMGKTISGAPFKLRGLLFGDTRNITWGKPVVAIGTLGSLLFFRKNRLLGAGFAAVIFFSLAWLFLRPHFTWWGMDFGIRHLIKLSIPLAIGYAALMDSVRVRGKTLIFGALSLVIILWAYLKLLQAQVTSLLTPNFVQVAAANIVDFVRGNFPSLLLGTESSYLRVVSTYGLRLAHLNFYDWVYLVLVPLYFFLLSLVIFLLFIFFKNKFYRNAHFQRAFIGVATILPLSFSTIGMFYPAKKPATEFNEFRRAGILNLLSGDIDGAAWCLRQGRKLKSDDKLSGEILGVLDSHKPLPQAFIYPWQQQMLLLVANESNPNVRSLLENNSSGEPGEFNLDFGNRNARQFLRTGWSHDEGPYSALGFPSFVWATGLHSELAFSSGRLVKDSRLLFRAMSDVKGQRILARLNGEDLGSIEMAAGWNLYSLKIPSSSIHAGLNKLDFDFMATVKPSDSDSRRLAVAFDWLSIIDLDRSTIDFGTLAGRLFLGKGWSHDEGPYPDMNFPTFVWGIGHQSDLRFYSSDRRDKVVTFRATTPFASGQSITVEANGREIDSVVMRTGWNEYTVKIPASYLNVGKNQLSFIYKIAKPPAGGGGTDTRSLAVAFDWLKIEDSGV